jgi:tRNA pseudouridine55 synthase
MNILTRDTLPKFGAWLDESRLTGGVLLVDKGMNWTSFDVIAKLRGITKIKKIGHAGTLDPLATGLLIVCCGPMTKRISEFQEQTKAYQAVVKLGATTKTDDAEAAEENIQDTSHLAEASIHAALEQFRGNIEQIPPMFSAIKKNGVPMYKLARKGEEIERDVRHVSVYKMEIVTLEMPFVTVNIECSKGTYIRSIARDLGTVLGVGGYLMGLRRTHIGAFDVANAVGVADISDAANMLVGSLENALKTI